MAMHHRGLAVFVLVVLGTTPVRVARADAADTLPSINTSKTRLVVKLRGDERVPVRSHFETNPPTIVVEFPDGRVAGALPERSIVQRGVIEEIRTAYAAPTSPSEPRWIKAMSIQLRGRYNYAVRAEAGQVTVEIEHPAEVQKEAFELGLTNGVLIAGEVPTAIQERFRAMQRALYEASGKAAPTGPLTPFVSGDSSKDLQRSSTSPRQSSTAKQGDALSAAKQPMKAVWAWLWLLAGMGAAGVLGGMVWVLSRRGAFAPVPLVDHGQAGATIIDQLIYRAFEQQGYVITQSPDAEASSVPLRILTKDDAKVALQSVTNGTFFEKTTVEQFVQAMGRLSIAQGFLIAPGSFTVPAQRYAREHGVTLIGREQLTELLSVGARQEHETIQIRDVYAQLETARENLNEYAKQLDMIRRQRNEACWLLGEERAKLAALEAQREELGQQIAQWKTQAEQWQASADANHKQWEESQWYLGESRAFIQHLEAQLQPLQEARAQLEERVRELTAKLQESERAREESSWSLGESKSAQTALQQQAQEFEQRVTQLQENLGTMRTELEEAQRTLQAERVARCRLEEQVLALQMNGERRKAMRKRIDRATIELIDSAGRTVFQGTPNDVSGLGFGVNAEPSIPLPETASIKLSLPGIDRQLKLRGKRVWLREDPTFNQSAGGYEFVSLPTEVRQTVEQVIASYN